MRVVSVVVLIIVVSAVTDVGAGVAVSLGIVVVGELSGKGCVGLVTTITAAARTGCSSTSSTCSCASTNTCSTSSVGGRNMIVLRVERGPSTTAMAEIASAVAGRSLAKAEEICVTGARLSPAGHAAEGDQESEEDEAADNTAYNAANEASIGAGAICVGPVC